MTSPLDILEGRQHRVCVSCGAWHGPSMEWIRCLEAAEERERQHPDRIRGQRAREAWEGFGKFGGRK